MDLQHHWLQWCNGGHYFLLSDRSCPWSGANELGLRERIKPLSRECASYAELLSHGVSEADLLRIVLAPKALSLDLLATPCGGDVSFELAQLVTDRNQFILAQFPSGALSQDLRPKPQTFAWYARKQGGVPHWTLVDAQYRHVWLAAHAYRSYAPAQLAQEIATSLDVSVEQLEQLASGIRPNVPSLYLAKFPFPFDRPQLHEDPAHPLHVANDRERLFVATNYPLIPWGHVTFLNTFYEPLLVDEQERKKPT